MCWITSIGRDPLVYIEGVAYGIGNPFQMKIYKFPRHWESSDRILLLILLLLIRGPNRGTTLILTRNTKKKKINPRNSHNNQKHLSFDLVDNNHHHR